MILRWIHHRGAWRWEPFPHKRSTKEKCFSPMRVVVWENLSSHYSEISLTESLSPAGRAPSISDSLLLNWHKYLPFTMCQLFLQCQRIWDSERVFVDVVSPRCVSTLRCTSCLTVWDLQSTVLWIYQLKKMPFPLLAEVPFWIKWRNNNSRKMIVHPL